MSEPKKSPAKKVSVWVVIFLCAFFLMAIALPNFIKARSTSAANACVNNLRQIDAAANQFALETGKTNGEAINFPNDLTPYIKLNSAGSIPSCPGGGTYHLTKIGETPTCSQATNGMPWHALQ